MKSDEEQGGVQRIRGQHHICLHFIKWQPCNFLYDKDYAYHQLINEIKYFEQRKFRKIWPAETIGKTYTSRPKIHTCSSSFL